VIEEERLMMTGRLGLAGLLGLLAACAGHPAATSPTPEPATASAGSDSRIRVQINNQNFNDMNVYLLDRGTRVLLGAANGLTQTTLLLPTNATASGGRIELQADPFGISGPIRTPELLVAPGEQVYWTIGPDRAGSYASVG
jgi:hypothetical protein